MVKHWWQEAVVYQVYPRSFQDSNGDGIGDLQGLIQRLDYLQALGVSVLWLNPIYQSPNDDNGYDISDYTQIMADFGTMADFSALLTQAHARGLKIVMDLVVNHTSDEHPWFIESRKSKDNPYRDYYLWRDGHDGQAPNQWQSFFSGPAWTYDAQTAQYYLHLFSKKQPDLNWANQDVRQAIYQMMRGWLDKGIDGFRMDVINMIAKPADLQGATQLPRNGAHIHEYLQEMNREVLSHYDMMTVGEMDGTTPEMALQYTGFDTHELNMLFQFEHMQIDADPVLGKWRPQPWSLQTLKAIMSKWQTALDGKAWNSLYWNNHDQPRVVSRFGDDRPEYRVRSAKMLGAVLHFMQGTPYIYQGEELGMTNVAFPEISQYRDIETLNAYHELVDSGRVTPQAMMAAIHHSSRDNARTPMQWDATANAGFTIGTPWLAVNPNYREINAQAAQADPDSVWHFYQQMNTLRKQYPVITYGHYQLLDPEAEATWCYARTLDDERLIVAANFTATPQPVPAAAQTSDRQLLGNYPATQAQTLRPYEVRVLFNA